MSNKAHTATLNRIRQRLGIHEDTSDEYDIRTGDMIVEVETSATVAEAVERLKRLPLPSYIAVTNKEGITHARGLVEGTSIGVMDPQGNIIVEANPPDAVDRLEDQVSRDSNVDVNLN